MSKKYWLRRSSGVLKFIPVLHGDHCAICLDVLRDNEGFYPRLVEALQPCGHQFHNDCINFLQLSNSFTCPLCRKVYTRDYDAQHPYHARKPPPPPPPPRRRLGDIARRNFLERQFLQQHDLDFPRHLDNS